MCQKSHLSARSGKVTLGTIGYKGLKKAFDSIQHNLLWKKLHALGVSGQIIRVVQSMYAKGTARVKLTMSEATKSFHCQKGVRQGCNLRPLLFSVF